VRGDVRAPGVPEGKETKKKKKKKKRGGGEKGI
jgi:hypothetical protein